MSGMDKLVAGLNINIPAGEIIGSVLFIGGWLYMEYLLSMGRNISSFVYILPVVGIMTTAMIMRKFMDSKTSVPFVLPIIFAVLDKSNKIKNKIIFIFYFIFCALYLYMFFPLNSYIHILYYLVH